MRFETGTEATNEQLLETLARQRLERFRRRSPVTRDQITRTVQEILRREEERRSEARGEPFSFAKAVRGLCALRHQSILMDSAQEDAEYAQRALTTGATPGSYLVPAIQADAITGQLAQLATARAAGGRIWPMKGIQDLNVPVAVAGSPQFVWQAQNSRQTASDPNLGQMAFDLKLSQALLLLPIQLFRAALPQWDAILEDSFALGLAEAEDQAMHATSTVANGPLALLSQAGISTLNAAGGSANGGNLAYGDLVGVLQKIVDLKARPPFAWFLAGRTWLRILSINDTTSRPILDDFAPSDGGPQIGHLFGFPVFSTASIPVTESVGSGSNQSHAVFTNPKAIHIAESGDVSLETSTDFALESGDVALRVGHKIAFGYQPAASLVVLAGI